MELIVTGKFDAAHKLALPYSSPCNRLHGHTYRYEVTLNGFTHETDTDMVIDAKFVKGLFNEYDHQYLNELVDFHTTAENLAVHLVERLLKLMNRKGLVSLKLWETDSCCARVVGERTEGGSIRYAHEVRGVVFDVED